MNNSSLHLVTRTLLPVIKGMCHEPEMLQVSEVPDPKQVLDKIILLSPSSTDSGVLHGTAGRQIKAIQRIFSTAFLRVGLRVDVRIEETYEGEKRGLPPFKFNPNFEKDSNFTRLFAQVLSMVFPTSTRIDRRTETDRDTGNPFEIIIVHGDAQDVNALADVFYPFGMRQGTKLKIRPPKLYDHNPLRTSAVPR